MALVNSAIAASYCLCPKSSLPLLYSAMPAFATAATFLFLGDSKTHRAKKRRDRDQQYDATRIHMVILLRNLRF